MNPDPLPRGVPPGDRAGASAFTALFLVAANVIPLWGVLSWGWQAFEVVVLYWLENVVVGLINLLKMALASPRPERLRSLQKLDERPAAPGGDPELARQAERWMADNDSQIVWLHHVSKLFLLPFFIFHYGMFTLVHGMFVFFLLGQRSGEDLPFSGNPFEVLPEMLHRVFSGGAAWGALALAASHLVSFACHFLFRGEFRRKTAAEQMAAPYGRVVVLHVAILGGAFAITALGSPLALLVILVAGKTILDLALHRRSHR